MVIADADADVIVITALSIFLILALCAALVLVFVSLRRPANLPLIVASGIVVACIIVVAVVPQNVPTLIGMAVALLGTALAVVGGDPVTRRVLEIATRGSVREGKRGGIIVEPAETDGAATRAVEVLRGGTTIGYLERIGVALAIIAGFPEAIAVIVAIKGIGRFAELDAPAVRERFIVGTLASLLWASIVAGLVHLAIW